VEFSARVSRRGEEKSREGIETLPNGFKRLFCGVAARRKAEKALKRPYSGSNRPTAGGSRRGEKPRRH